MRRSPSLLLILAVAVAMYVAAMPSAEAAVISPRTCLHSERDNARGFPPPEWRARVAVLLVGYQDYELAGGHVTSYPLTAAFALGYPYAVLAFTGPPSGGVITLRQTVTADTLFRATIIRDGRGEILYPQHFLPADSFGVAERRISEPRFINVIEGPEAEAKRAWEAVRNLDVAARFAGDSVPYEVAIYLYKPTVGYVPGVGPFDPESARWIVVLHQPYLERNRE